MLTETNNHGDLGGASVKVTHHPARVTANNFDDNGKIIKNDSIAIKLFKYSLSVFIDGAKENATLFFKKIIVPVMTNYCREKMMIRTLSIKNNANKSIFVKYYFLSKVKVSEILAGETVKLTFDKGTEETIHIKCYDETSFFCIRDMPVYTWSNIRTIKFGLFFNFDCIVDVKEYYSLLEINEFFCESGKYIFRFLQQTLMKGFFIIIIKIMIKKPFILLQKYGISFLGVFGQCL